MSGSGLFSSGERAPKVKRFWLSLLLIGFASLLSAEENGAVFTASGLNFRYGKIDWTLAYPVLSGVENGKPVVESLSDRSVRLKYADGNRLELELDGEICRMKFLRAPGEIELEMLLPLTLRQGGRWKCGGREGEFPKDLKGQGFLAGENCDRFEIVTENRETFSIQVDPICWHQLQDNRAWNWNVYRLWYKFPSREQYTLRWSYEPARGTAEPLVDRFGQLRGVEWPGKVRSEEELSQDCERDRAYYDSLVPPERDLWGGLPGSREEFGFRKTGFFHVEKIGTRPVIVDPEGNLFFQLGVCCIGNCDDYTYVKGREEIFEFLPAADDPLYSGAYFQQENFSFYILNYIRKTGRAYDQTAWQREMFERLRKWGFTGQGAFGANRPGNEREGFSECPTFSITQWEQFRFIDEEKRIYDPFDPVNAEQMDRIMKRDVAPRADSPEIFGYFSGNEVKYSGAGRTVAAGPGIPAKLELIRLFREKYRDIAAFNSVWQSSARSFDELSGIGLIPKNEECHADLAAFEKHFYEAYFKLIRETFRKYDPNHLYLGERFLVGETYREAPTQACGKYCDLFSVNYYCPEFDPSVPQRIGNFTGRPVLLSEWSYGTSEQGQFGVQNKKNEQERGMAYRRYVENAAATDWVVGVQWFSLLDQAVTGRFFQKYGGESMNIGLLNVADRPYKVFLDDVMKSNYRIYDLLLRREKPVPVSGEAGAGERLVQAARVLDGYRLDGSFRGYAARPTERVTRSVGGKQPGSDDAADFHCGWDDSHLYVAIHVVDPTPGNNLATGKQLWIGDAVEVFIGRDLEASGSLRFDDRQLIVGAGDGMEYQWYNSTTEPEIRRAMTIDPDGTGYLLEFAVPWKELGIEKPEKGMKFRFDLGVDYGHGEKTSELHRLNQLMWNGIADNSNIRDHWGTLVLVD